MEMVFAGLLVLILAAVVLLRELGVLLGDLWLSVGWPALLAVSAGSALWHVYRETRGGLHVYLADVLDWDRLRRPIVARVLAVAALLLHLAPLVVAWLRGPEAASGWAAWIAGARLADHLLTHRLLTLARPGLRPSPGLETGLLDLGVVLAWTCVAPTGAWLMGLAGLLSFAALLPTLALGRYVLEPHARVHWIGLVVLLTTFAAPATAADWTLFARKSFSFGFSLGCESWDLGETMFLMGIQEERNRHGLPTTVVEANGLLAGVARDPFRFNWRKVALAAPLHVTASALWTEVDPFDPRLQEPGALERAQRRAASRRQAARFMLLGNGVTKCVIAYRNRRHH